MNKKLRVIAGAVAAVLTGAMIGGATLSRTTVETKAASDTIVLRVCNWEEYIDEGDWDEDEVIDLESGDIFGETSMVEDFENWFREVYGRDIRVEYSCTGTNEELYSQLTLGDVYDLVCPSDYMIMKLMAEGALQPLSDDFFDEDNEYNYYINGVSPYIRQIFEENEINGEAWANYAAGYMWGTTGFVYNPDVVSEEEASTWELLINPKFYRQITTKDNIRDALFPTVAIVEKDTLLDEGFIAAEDYQEKLAEIMNDTSVEMFDKCEAMLKQIRANVYSFETDSGKADMVTGKVVANLQWSGDAVYTMDQAEEDDVYLNWATPAECTDLWFDGWCMLKAGIDEDPDKQIAAEAFINFVSRPDNAIRNMYYIGYTSTIAAADDGRIFEYIEWSYGADEDEEDAEDVEDDVEEDAEDDAEEEVEEVTLAEYPLGYFFSGVEDDEDFILIADEEMTHRQLAAQYPSKDEIGRSAIMQYFNDDANARANQMWINIRCFNLSQIEPKVWVIIGAVIGGIAVVIALAIFFKKLYVLNRAKNR